ncbi:MAG: MBL fold metallo-hydrolase, partial [Actinobacteria bacterium]|nr:MBL fold metallo-hydrolase [Actinomycetota bacterium]NIU71901.1 MBL fold metallo-hydrolase [Actinomycetota bacterium]NIW33845.1 MBL fold metallo-hydrolase [Actinomycetota bacterium]
EAAGGDRVGVGITVDDGYVTCHLVEVGDGKVALVDACVSEDGSAIISELEEAGHAPEDVVAILLTHGHADHRGG